MKIRGRAVLHLSAIVTILAGFSACVTTKDITYFRPATKAVDKFAIEVTKRYQARISPGDILSIYVTGINEEAGAVFNPMKNAPTTTSAQQVGTIAPQVATGYTVDSAGFIDLPILGKVNAAGKTTQQMETLLKDELSKSYIISPTVTVRIANFRISVLGEVTRPAMYTIGNDQITLIEALALAGDITIYGKRNNVLVIREIDGKREFAKVDLTNMDVFVSDYYHLHPGDIVYVQPTAGKATSSDRVLQLAPLAISSLTLLVLILVSF